MTLYLNRPIGALPDLRKFKMSYEWDETKYRRADDGKFTSKGGAGGAPSLRQRGLNEPSPGPESEKRSLTRGESWQRIGTKIGAFPLEYTEEKPDRLPEIVTGAGDTGMDIEQRLAALSDRRKGRDRVYAERQAPVDWFKSPPKIDWQVPPDMPVEQHIETLRQLKGVIASTRQGAIEKARETRQWVAVHGIKDHFTKKRRTGDFILDPEAPAGAANRAYNHAAMLALHDFGIVDYDFQMSDAQKEELTPLIPFMRYTRRRLGSEMKIGELKGARRPYVAAFGKPFKQKKNGEYTGVERMRIRPNDVLVKRDPNVSPRIAPAMDDADRVLARAEAQTVAARPRWPGVTDPDVEAVMPDVDRILGPQAAQKPPETPGRRMARSRLIGDPSIPLAQALGKAAAFDESKHSRDEDGRFTSGDAVTAGAFAGAGVAYGAYGVPRMIRGKAVAIDELRSIKPKIVGTMQAARNGAIQSEFGRPNEMAEAARRKVMEEARNRGGDMVAARQEADAMAERVRRFKSARFKKVIDAWRKGQFAASRMLRDAAHSARMNTGYSLMPTKARVLAAGAAGLGGAALGLQSFRHSQEINAGGPRDRSATATAGDVTRVVGLSVPGAAMGYGLISAISAHAGGKPIGTLGRIAAGGLGAAFGAAAGVSALNDERRYAEQRYAERRDAPRRAQGGA